MMMFGDSIRMSPKKTLSSNHNDICCLLISKHIQKKLLSLSLFHHHKCQMNPKNKFWFLFAFQFYCVCVFVWFSFFFSHSIPITNNNNNNNNNHNENKKKRMTESALLTIELCWAMICHNLWIVSTTTTIIIFLCEMNTNLSSSLSLLSVQEIKQNKFIEIQMKRIWSNWN